jgi:8-oxo-dGTP pyrophosphatase MutT (NUDIX family)
MAQKTQRKQASDAAQIAALPVRRRPDGSLEVLLITSRETRRWIIPKGWPMKGLKDHKAAAKEAEEEAGVVGAVGKHPIGSYTYWKRRTAHFDLCEVFVYRLEVEDQLPQWREKHQRQSQWFSVQEAAGRVEEPGLGKLIESLEREEFPDAQARGTP